MLRVLSLESTLYCGTESKKRDVSDMRNGRYHHGHQNKPFKHETCSRSLEGSALFKKICHSKIFSVMELEGEGDLNYLPLLASQACPENFYRLPLFDNRSSA